MASAGRRRPGALRLPDTLQVTCTGQEAGEVEAQAEGVVSLGEAPQEPVDAPKTPAPACAVPNKLVAHPPPSLCHTLRSHLDSFPLAEHTLQRYRGEGQRN